MNTNNTTIIICCAGMGTRLGIGNTKALVDICGKPLIIRLLEYLDEYDDVRIVVGYHAKKVIDVVNSYRKNITFCFNNNYQNNGPAASMWKALLNAKENVLVLDGDLVFEPESFRRLLNYEKECIAYTKIKSDEPTFVNINDNYVLHFSTQPTRYIWPGIVKINVAKIAKGSNYVFETIENSLPIEALEINVMEIDTQDDYEKAINWVKNNYRLYDI